METREMRYFVAVAEELHFRHAAERLGIAQPALSRAISQLERRLGTALLERTSRAVSLTAAGAVLLDESRLALEAVEAAERRTRRAGLAADGPPEVVLVTKAGASTQLLAELLEAHAAESGAAPIDVRLCGPAQQAPLLRGGHADVALLHRPYDSLAGFEFEELRTEGQVLILPAGHELAGRSHVVLADVLDLPGLPMPRWPRPDGSYADGIGPEIRDHAQLHQLIELGRASTIAPASYGANLRGDVAAVPVLDAPDVTTVIAWPAGRRHAAVARLVETAVRLSRHPPLQEYAPPSDAATLPHAG